MWLWENSGSVWGELIRCHKLIKCQAWDRSPDFPDFRTFYLPFPKKSHFDVLIFSPPSFLSHSVWLGVLLGFWKHIQQNCFLTLQLLYTCSASLRNWIYPSSQHHPSQALPSSPMLSPAMKWWRPVAVRTVKWWVPEGDPMDDVGYSGLLLWVPVYSLFSV